MKKLYIDEWQEYVGKINTEKGFRHENSTMDFWRAVALIHTELSELAEDFYVNGEITDNGREELADVAIRVLDFADRFNIDLEKEMIEKMAYNETRPYRHGKKG